MHDFDIHVGRFAGIFATKEVSTNLAQGKELLP
jgi:hypothetical protein